jgi:hypothetical protein
LGAEIEPCIGDIFQDRLNFYYPFLLLFPKVTQKRFWQQAAKSAFAPVTL